MLECSVVNADAREWVGRLNNRLGSDVGFLTSICDASEIGLNPKDKKDTEKYCQFVRDISGKIFDAMDPKSFAIFIQTDRKCDGIWVDKAYLVTDEAHQRGLKTVWHKILLNHEPETINLFRPTFTHMMCFSKLGHGGKPTPDVIYNGERLYKNGMGINGVQHALTFLASKGIKTVIDPFCGYGTVLIVAKKYFHRIFDAVIGVDIDPDQCLKTEENVAKIK